MLNRIFSIVYIAFIGITSALFFCLALVIRIFTFPFDRRRIITNVFSAFWASFYIWCMPVWAVRVIGRDKLSLKRNYVMVSNHQSQLDILVLYRLLFPYRWVSKAEVFRLPFIGWNMRLNGDIPLRRGDKASVSVMMAQCEKLLKENISIFFFPEGTRSKDGRLRAFKPGAFILAKAAKVPIKPIVLNHTRQALPKHSLTLQGRHEMTVKILDEIPYERFKDMEPGEIAEMTRDIIGAHVHEMQAPDLAN